MTLYITHDSTNKFYKILLQGIPTGLSMLRLANMFDFLFVFPSRCSFKLVEIRNTHAREVRDFDASSGAKTSDRGTKVSGFVMGMEREEITEFAENDLGKMLLPSRFGG